MKFFRITIIVLLGYLVINFGIGLIRRINIIWDMRSVYADAKIYILKCDNKPIDNEALDKRYVWFGDGIPEEELYYFEIKDSEGHKSSGFATKYGKVIFDDYASIYYADEIRETFINAVDFENNFPNLRYFIPKFSSMDIGRYVFTQDCNTFEGFMSARTIGYNSLGTGGYPTLFVGIDETNTEDVDEIINILKDKEISIYVQFVSTSGEDFNDVNTLRFRDICGGYYPFDANYEEVILGK